MITDRIAAFLARASDKVFEGRNRARLWIGTDRKNTRSSGQGDGGQNDAESGTIDICVGFDPTSGDIDHVNDKSRIYISGKTDPDDYFSISAGDSVSGEPATVMISDNVRIKARKTLKIVVNDKFSFTIDNDGNMKISSSGKISVSSNDIAIGDENAQETPAWSSKVLEELQKISSALGAAIAPTSGGPVTYGGLNYIAPTSVSEIGATKTKIS